MKKRQFAKILFGGCLACGFLFQGRKLLSLKNDNYINAVRIPICYHCNLNCAGCNHFSVLAPNYQMPLDIIEKDLKQLSKLTNGKVGEIVLFGGEPLLHKDIEDIMQIASKYFPKSNHRILSNGILLNDMKESFWKKCSDTNTNITYTLYDKYEHYPKDFNDAYVNAKKYNVAIELFRDGNIFQNIQISNKSKYDKEKNYFSCPDCINCATLDNGLLYVCAIHASMRFFNNHFKDKQIPMNKEDILNIYEISDVSDILNFFEKPKEICSHCARPISKEFFEWHKSKKEIGEWFVS